MSASFKVTWRYRHFASRCGSCRSTTGTATSVLDDGVQRFQAYGRRVYVRDDVAGVWRTHRQTAVDAAESFGVLMGTTSVDRRKIWIESVTSPMAA